MAQTYEIEIKSLLGTKENADALKFRMQALDSRTSCVSKNKQLNHYFVEGDVKKLYQKVQSLFSNNAKEKLKSIIKNGKNFSVRTRDKDGKTFLVLKASVDDTTSSNGIARMEFEEEVKLSLDELDALLLNAGFIYQAKWSREREEYLCKGTTVCLDKNAGYGYLAEFERVLTSKEDINEAQNELRDFIKELGIEELPQERLERMFAHYNGHWKEYYGTDNVFVIQ